MADHVAQRVHRRLTDVMLAGMCGAAIALAGCANSSPAALDAVPLSANLPAATVSPGPDAEVSPKPTPTATGSISVSNTGSAGVPASADGNETLAVLAPHPVTAGLPGINLTPRLALNECPDILDVKPTTALPM